MHIEKFKPIKEAMNIVEVEQAVEDKLSKNTVFEVSKYPVKDRERMGYLTTN